MPSPFTPETRALLARYLEFQRELGVEGMRWPAHADAAGAEAVAAPAAPVAPRVPAAAAAWTAAAPTGETLDAIQADVGADCRRCKLHEGRNSIVFGSGNPKAELLFVGEGPGADEDMQGLPFVGRGGQLLTDMIQKGLEIPRSDVYICNVVKCRPPGNRTPEADEIAACSPFLLRQIRAVRPRMVCALGATAAQVLRPFKGPLASLRGSIHTLQMGDFETKLVVTYHPAYLLRDPSQKKEAWKDLQLIMGYLWPKQ